MDEDVMQKVQNDVMDWATERIDEISQLKEQDSFRKDFIGNLAHELKTPIFNIQGYILTLLEGALEDPDNNRKFLMKAAKNVDRMATLVEDLDIVTKIEGGSLELDLVEFNLADLVRDTLEELEPRAKRQNITMSFLEENRTQLPVLGDARKLGRSSPTSSPTAFAMARKTAPPRCGATTWKSRSWSRWPTTASACPKNTCRASSSGSTGWTRADPAMPAAADSGCPS